MMKKYKNILIIIFLIYLFFTLLNSKIYEKFNNYILYNDQKNSYMRFLDRFHGMKPNYYYINNKYGNKYFLSNQSKPFLYNPNHYFFPIPGNLGVIKI